MCCRVLLCPTAGRPFGAPLLLVWRCCGCGCCGCCFFRLPWTTFRRTRAHDSPRTPNVHISGHLRFKTPPKFHEKTPKETQKQRIGGGERKKKTRNFGPPPFGSPQLRGPTFSRFGPTIGAPLFGAPFWVKHKNTKIGHNRSTQIGQKVGLAKVGFGQSRKIRMAKVGMAKSVSTQNTLFWEEGEGGKCC